MRRLSWWSMLMKKLHVVAQYMCRIVVGNSTLLKEGKISLIERGRSWCRVMMIVRPILTNLLQW
jgi:hypothetical protein